MEERLIREIARVLRARRAEVERLTTAIAAERGRGQRWKQGLQKCQEALKECQASVSEFGEAARWKAAYEKAAAQLAQKTTEAVRWRDAYNACRAQPPQAPQPTRVVNASQRPVKARLGDGQERAVTPGDSVTFGDAEGSVTIEEP